MATCTNSINLTTYGKINDKCSFLKMVDLDFYLINCFDMSARIALDTLSDDEKKYVEYCAANPLKEWVRRVAQVTLSGNIKSFQSILAACIYFNVARRREINNIHALVYVNALEPLFVSIRPTLTDILNASHSTCVDCCELYTPCHVGNWIDANPELYDSEVAFFRLIRDKFCEYVSIDIEPYSRHDVLDKRDVGRISYVSPADRARQLYSVILYADEC
jgi:hypothetical protein